MTTRWQLTGRRALVTGGTKGIGWAVAEELLTLGAEVLIVARNAEEVAAAVAGWTSRCDASRATRVPNSAPSGHGIEASFAAAA